MNEIEIGDIVRIKQSGEIGMMSYIKDYGTHICYFIDLGKLLKFPARLEWLELYKKASEL